MPALRDDRGTDLSVGDRVVQTAVDDGAPAWATRGTVVGFGRTRVRVQWDGYGYDERIPFHAARPTALRKGS